VLRGTTTYLTRFDKANIETARGWLNDPAVNEWLLSSQLPYSSEQEAAFFDLTEREWSQGTAYRFEIHVAEDDRFIGITGLDDVSLVHRRGEVGIFVGSLPHQNRGYGRDAIAIRANTENERAVHLYRSVGFTETGRERECAFMRGRFHDHVCFDMLAPEFHERYGLYG
jgi:RimJ/RimL family protein N-acetyltransferase